MNALDQMRQEIASLLLQGKEKMLAQQAQSHKTAEADLSEKASCLLCFYPHVHADGDALGSCLALALVCKKLGYEVAVLGSEAPQESLRLTLGDALERLFVYEKEQVQALAKKQAFALRLDSSKSDRLAERYPLYKEKQIQGKSLTLDHHLPEQSSWNEEEEFSETLLYRDISAAATSEIVLSLVQEMEKQSGLVLLDREIATCLMVGLITDTGRFSYSNVTENTFKAAADLMKFDVSLPRLVFPLYDEKRLSSLRLKGKVFQEAQFSNDGRMVTALIDSVAYAKEQADSGDMEGFSAELRNVRGVDMAIFLRTFSDGQLKASVRSSENFDAHRLVSRYGGGGHAKAAGFSLSLEQLIAQFGYGSPLEKSETQSPYSSAPLFFMGKDRYDQSELYKKQLLPSLLKSLEKDMEEFIAKERENFDEH